MHTCDPPFQVPLSPLTHIRPPLPGAANRFPDKCDADPEGARALNVAATAALAARCAARGALLLYISTDYVFPGRPGEAPYAADAEPAPTNLYGRTKLEGERAVLDAYASASPPREGLGVVLRVPVLYGDAEVPAESAVNVLMDALWRSQELLAAPAADKIKMDHWALRYPTNTEDVGRVCHGTLSLCSCLLPSRLSCFHSRRDGIHPFYTVPSTNR